MPIPEVLINIIVSVILAKLVGPVGVFLGTIISSVFTCVWKEPSVLLKNGFGCGIKNYWKKYIKYLVVVLYFLYIIIAINVIAFAIVALIQPNNQIIEIIARLMICTMVYIILNALLFKNEDEYKYIISLIKSLEKSKV